MVRINTRVRTRVWQYPLVLCVGVLQDVYLWYTCTVPYIYGTYVRTRVRTYHGTSYGIPWYTCTMVCHSTIFGTMVWYTYMAYHRNGTRVLHNTYVPWQYGHTIAI